MSGCTQCAGDARYPARSSHRGTLVRILALVLVAAASAAGCYKVEVVNRPQPLHEKVSESVNGRWYHGLLSSIELSGPVELDQACPGGQWTRLSVKTTGVQAFLTGVTRVYNPQAVTVYCEGGLEFDAAVDDKGKMHKVGNPVMMGDR